MVFALTNLVGGSGFLAIYLTGLVAGNRRGGTGDNVLKSMDSMAWLAQSGMFLILGLLVTPSRLTEHLAWALAVAAFLMLLARPLAVWISLLPFRFTWREEMFIAWTGLRGAVPIVLAVFPLLAGVEQTYLLFDITLVVVLISLIGQGASLRFMARRLKVSVPPSTEPRQTVALAAPRDRYLLQFQVEDGARAVGKPLAELSDDGRTPLMLYRNHTVLSPRDEPVIEAGDLISWLAPLSEKSALSDLCHKMSQDEKRLRGLFRARQNPGGPIGGRLRGGISSPPLARTHRGRAVYQTGRQACRGRRYGTHQWPASARPLGRKWSGGAGRPETAGIAQPIPALTVIILTVAGRACEHGPHIYCRHQQG